MRICRGEESPRLPFHLSSPLTNIVFLPTLRTYNLHFLAPHAIFPNKRLMKQVVKNVDQAQHTSRSGTSLRNFPRDSRKDQKGLICGTVQTSRSPQKHLYERMTAFTERNEAIDLQHSCLEQNSLVMYHTHPTELVHRVWLVNTLTAMCTVLLPKSVTLRPSAPFRCTGAPNSVH